MAGPGTREDFPTAEVHASKQCEKMRIDIIVEESSMKERFKSVMGLEDSQRSQLSQTKWPPIPKVPQMLRGTNDFNKVQFEPRVISVGPYHHNKPELEPAELPKRQMTKQFIQDSGHAIEVLYNKIATEISELRKCYSEKEIEKYNDEELAWMMLVDGCSLLHYIHCCLTEGKLKEFPIMRKNAAFVQQDLFLLENQLPFRVLELLLESRFKNGEGMQKLEKFIWLTINGWEAGSSKVTHVHEEQKLSHLLDLLRRRLLGKQTGSQTGAGKSWNSFRNVNELKAAGIRFKPSKSGSLKDISFDSYIFFGCLKLPTIIIDDSTKSRFLNMIAYEMCPEAPSESEFTSYVCFLDSLIDDREDVKELRQQHILRNFLGSDEDVAKLFNEITIDLVPNSDVYKDVKGKIQTHYENIVSTWMTQGLHNHFSSPWTVLAFLGAILALFFGGVQTYYTVFPRWK